MRINGATYAALAINRLLDGFSIEEFSDVGFSFTFVLRLPLVPTREADLILAIFR